MRFLRVCVFGPLLWSIASVSTADPPRTDSHDRPLPEGAVARLGSDRWRVETRIQAMEFSPDGSYLAYGGRDFGTRNYRLGYQLITLLEAETGRVSRRLLSPDRYTQAIAVSPSGKRIAVWKEQGVVGVVDVQSGRTLWQFSTEEDSWRGTFSSAKNEPDYTVSFKGASPPLKVQFSHDEKLLFATMSRRIVWVLDAQSGAPVRRLLEPRAMALALLPDGKTMMSARNDETVGIWDIASGEEKKRFALDLRPIESGPDKAQFVYVQLLRLWPSPDQRTVVLGSRDRIVAVDLGTGKPIKTLARASGNVLPQHSVVFAPDGMHLAVLEGYGKSQLRIIETRHFKTRHRLTVTSYAPKRLVFSPDSQRLGVASLTSLRWWEIESGKELPTEPSHSNRVIATALSPDGSLATTADSRGAVRVWSTQTGKQLHHWPTTMLGQSVSCLAFSPDGRLLAANLGANTGLIRCEDGQLLHELPASRFPRKLGRGPWSCTLKFSADGKKLASVRSSSLPRMLRHYQLWDTATGELLHDMDLDTAQEAGAHWAGKGVIGHVFSAISPDLDRAASLLFSSHTCMVWDTQTGKGLYRIESQPGFTSALFAPDGRSFVVGTQDGELHVVATATGTVLHKISGPPEQVFPRAFLDDGQLLITEHSNNTSRLWDMKTGTAIRQYLGFRLGACSGDERLAASIEADQSVLVWDLAGFRDKVVDRRKTIFPHYPGDAMAEALPMDNPPTETEAESAALTLLRGSASPRKSEDPNVALIKETIATLQSKGAACDYDQEGRVSAVTFFQVSPEPECTDAEMELMGKLTDLRILKLRISAVTDDGMVHLKNLKNLRYFYLTNAKITGAGLVHLKGLHDLRVLSLQGNAITDESLANIAATTKLELLDLARTPITDEGLKHIRGHIKLRSLSLDATKITDSGLRHIKEMTALSRLYLSQTAVGDAGLEYLKELKSLNTLHLSETGVTDAGLRHVASMTKLNTLRLVNVKVAGPGLAHLKDLAGLQRLDLRGSSITDEGLEYIKLLPNLRYVYLSETATTPAALEQLKKACPNLRSYAGSPEEQANEEYFSPIQ